MKKLFLIVGLIIPAMAFSQSNQGGTVQLGFGGGIALGGASITSTMADSINGPSLGDSKSSGLGIKAGFGVKVQIGLAEKISAGVYVRKEIAGYDTNFGDDFYYDGAGTTEITTNSLSLGVEFKFYAVNKDRFNLFFGPAIGFTTGKATLKGYYDDIDGSLGGLNYALGGGINWYWGDHVGMSFDFGYTGQSLSGEPDDLSDFVDPNDPLYDPYDPYDNTGITTKYKVKGGNVYIGLSFIAKFGGN